MGSGYNTELLETSDTMPLVEININDERWHEFKNIKNILETIIGHCLSSTMIDCSTDSEISILLANDETIQQLNKRWRSKDSPTNVLSFVSQLPPKDTVPHLFGDIILSFDTIERESKDTGIKIEHHIAHLTVHGFLHLAGYDHKDDKSASKMEKLEIDILSMIGIANPYI